MERKIGEIFEENGEWYQCVHSANCRECAFRTNETSPYLCGQINKCLMNIRNDKTSVIFKKLEKVGEPYRVYDGVLLQPYRIFEELYINQEVNENYIVQEDREKNIIAIEIKQNKEDMEEKKLNLKPFSLELAKQGKSVCTRDGRKARIICFDRKGDEKCILALVESNISGAEVVIPYLQDGKFYPYKDDEDDLMMLPEKKEGWVNVYKVGARLETGRSVYSTKDVAIKCINSDRGKHIATVKVEWEE